MKTEVDLSKYRPLSNAKEGEIESIRLVVKSDKNYLPKYHIYPKTGLLNDPNGLVYDGENYHVFYQWYPYSAMHGMKHWEHLVTKDFINFEQRTIIEPKEDFEKHGCYSGGAITIDDNLYCFYTGNTRQGENLDRSSYQNLAIFNKNGDTLKEKYCVASTPKGFTEHFRDPKPFIENGQLKFICASQRDNETGTATVFSYDDSKKEATFLGELEVEGINNEDVFMWECPDILKVENNDLFIWCPQGIKPSNDKFNNIYSAVYGLGSLEDMKFKVDSWDEIDRGFDFYAPQTISQSEESILIGWIGIPFATYPSDVNKWQGALTMPRVLSIKDNKLHQMPHKNIYDLVDSKKHEVLKEGSQETKYDLSCSYLKVDTKNKDFNLELFKEENSSVSISYKDNYLTVDRGTTLQTDFMKEYGDTREIHIEELKDIEIFIDNSIIEMYINQGEYTMTSRFFIENKKNNVNIEGQINIDMYEMKEMSLWEK